jgi:thiamine pyrophosphokinase
MKALIAGSGSLSNLELLKKHYAWADLVIAADGGAEYFHNAGLMPHVLLGDFDSLPTDVLEEFKAQKDIEIKTFPANKDFTDMELALNLAVERGADEAVILGASGTRLDHTTANIHLLYKLLTNNIKGCIEDDNNLIYLINDKLTLKKQDNRKVSLLPMPPYVSGLTTQGLSYPLSDATLAFGTGQGISNEFADDTASITLKEGLLLVFVSKD